MSSRNDSRYSSGACSRAVRKSSWASSRCRRSPFSFQTPQENEERHKRREAELEQAHREIVDPEVDRLRERGLKVRGVIRHGHPAETLCEVAAESGAAHIVVGKTGSSRIRAQLFGSVAHSLVQISKQPVTVVP